MKVTFQERKWNIHVHFIVQPCVNYPDVLTFVLQIAVCRNMRVKYASVCPDIRVKYTSVCQDIRVKHLAVCHYIQVE